MVLSDCLNEINSLSCSNSVAESFSRYLLFCAEKVASRVPMRPPTIIKHPWFDDECKYRRNFVINNPCDISAESDYKKCTQSKKRAFKNENIDKLFSAIESKSTEFWKLLKNLTPSEETFPDRDSLFSYFKNLSASNKPDYFNYDLESEALKFLSDYDDNLISLPASNPLQQEVLNSNYTYDEVYGIIQALNGSKCSYPLPAKIIKAGIDFLTPILTTIFNYILERREFPKIWCEGLRLALFKAGDRLDPACYRGLTILPTCEKIFEVGFNKRVEFLNEALDKVDRNNGGFLKGSRTADNIFILQSIYSRQLALGKPLILIFVDFSKAFDLVSRNILFFKLIQSGWSGRLIDTMRSLYNQTSFRVRVNGKLSESVSENLGVNQGGSASGILFRKFLKNLGDYLDTRYGIRIGSKIIAYLLWADDLVIVAESYEDAQKQLDGLFEFCRNYLMIVNEIKTKFMVFNLSVIKDLFFNNVALDMVTSYKYVGNILSPSKSPLGNIFHNNLDHLLGKANKALYAMRFRLKNASPTPASVSIHLFNSLVRPIMCTGSEIWGVYSKFQDSVDVFYRHFLRHLLCVKNTTSNEIVHGELGQIPISYDILTNCFLYFYRALKLPHGSLLKHVFDEMLDFHFCGFPSWISAVLDAATKYDIQLLDNDDSYNIFKTKCRLK